MEPDAIRFLEVQHDDIQQANVSTFVRIFSDIAQRSDDAKQLRGKCVIVLPSYDSDPRANWAIPEIRKFIQALDREMPHFAYFLFGDPTAEHLFFYLLCLVPIRDEATGPSYLTMDLVSAAVERAEHVARFCQQIDDDVDRATTPIMLNLPVEVVKDVPTVASRVLEAMGPTLAAFERNADPRLSTPDGQAFVASLLARASTLCGIDPKQYASQELLIRELSARANKVSPEELDRFENAFDECSETVGNRKVKISTIKLRQVVKEQRRAAYQFVETHLMMAAAQPGYLQPASIVAAALMAEFDDPAPMRRVQERAEELDVPPELWMPQTLS